MKNKKLKYIFLITGIFVLLALCLMLYTTLSVKLSGQYQVSVNTTADSLPEFKIIAKGVFGSETEFVSVNGNLFIEGYYKSLRFEIPIKDCLDVKNITFFDYQKQGGFNYVPQKSHIDNGVFIIEKSIGLKQGKNFFIKISDILKFELKKSFVKDILLGILVLGALIIIFILFNRLRAASKKTGQNTYKIIATNILVFLTGTVFWLIVILLLLEISLRIIGFVYSGKQTSANINNDDGKFVVLCIGDSFTYGVGSTKGNDYPAQLQRLLQQNTNQEVIVINRGRCAQNSTQTIEHLQEDLNSCKPDLVIMMFGMANSWNYYGYHDSFNYWERIRVVKLFRRIRYNIKYKGASSDTEQNVKDYAADFLVRSLKYKAFGDEAFSHYYYVGRYFLAMRDWQNAFRYLSFSLSLNQYDIESFNAIKVCLREFDNEKFGESGSGEIEKTVVAKTQEKLDEIIREYPKNEVFTYLKALYLAEKSSTSLDSMALIFRRNQISQDFNFILVSDVEKSFDNCFDSIAAFYSSIKNEENIIQIDISMAWLSIGNKRFEEALEILNNMDSPKDSLSLSLFSLAKEIAEGSIKQDYSFNSIEDEKIKTFLQENYADMLLKSESIDDFRFGISQIFNYNIKLYLGLNQMYFLPHKLKRTANIEQSKIFDWIRTDIEAAVEMCLKQNYPVICMNYPIIPPPNSEEISFWAYNVGNIWKETSQKYKLEFIDNDSVFKSLGNTQNEYFEPHATGSEHCNNKGYGLIAKNISYLLEHKKVIK